MSTEDSFVDEVTDAVRSDRLYAAFRKYGWIGIVAVLLIVGGAGYNEWQKAQTAARFGNPTALFEQRLQKEGQLRYLTFPVGVVASEGGVPIKRDGKTVGAVGVSGATSQEDGLIAAAGIAALEAALAPKK